MTASCLWILQQESYKDFCKQSNDTDTDFVSWCEAKMQESSHFFFWHLILKKEMLLFTFLRSIRSNDLATYIETIKAFIPLLFALGKINYAKWMPVHIDDLEVLRTTDPAEFSQIARSFTVRKSTRPFSEIAIDHAHEMNNESAKGALNVISVWDSPGTLTRWMLSSPVIEEMLAHFESDVRCPTLTDPQKQKHSDDTPAKNQRIIKDITSMLSVFREVGNPFHVQGRLHNLESGCIFVTEVETDLRRMEALGLSQYDEFSALRIQSNEQHLLAPITKNKLKLPNHKPKKPTSSKTKIVKKDYGTYAKILLSTQKRPSDLKDFFRHENHAFPPSLSSDGSIRVAANKSDLVVPLLKGVTSSIVRASPASSCVIFDGAYIAQGIYPRSAMTYSAYASTEFTKPIKSLSHEATRVDVVFDTYKTPSIKDVARVKRGESGERVVRDDAQVPVGQVKWKNFLHNSNNKTAFYNLLARWIISHPICKDMVATIDHEAITNSQTITLDNITPCNHEEADTRLFLHALNASMNGHTSLTIRSSDTDVLVIAIHHFKDLKLEHLWIATGTGKDFRYLPVHEIVPSLGPSITSGILFFHAFTGCDMVSSFYYITKSTAWDIANDKFSEVWQIFQELSDQPDEISNTAMEKLERFTVLMYKQNSKAISVNDARREMIGEGRTVDRAPPTSSALLQHVKRAVYVGGHQWKSSLVAQQMLPVVTDWGWKQDGDEYLPVWTTLPVASKACKEFIKCGCLTKCGTICKCKTNDLPCSELCKCKGSCYLPK